MGQLKPTDIIIIGLFVLGLIFALSQKTSHQVVSQNNAVEVTLGQIEVVEPVN